MAAIHKARSSLTGILASVGLVAGVLLGASEQIRANLAMDLRFSSNPTDTVRTLSPADANSTLTVQVWADVTGYSGDKPEGLAYAIGQVLSANDSAKGAAFGANQVTTTVGITSDTIMPWWRGFGVRTGDLRDANGDGISDVTGTTKLYVDGTHTVPDTGWLKVISTNTSGTFGNANGSVTQAGSWVATDDLTVTYPMATASDVAAIPGGYSWHLADLAVTVGDVLPGSTTFSWALPTWTHKGTLYALWEEDWTSAAPNGKGSQYGSDPQLCVPGTAVTFLTPEPATLVLLGLGGLVCVIRRKRA